MKTSIHLSLITLEFFKMKSEIATGTTHSPNILPAKKLALIAPAVSSSPHLIIHIFLFLYAHRGIHEKTELMLITVIEARSPKFSITSHFPTPRVEVRWSTTFHQSAPTASHIFSFFSAPVLVNIRTTSGFFSRQFEFELTNC